MRSVRVISAVAVIAFGVCALAQPLTVTTWAGRTAGAVDGPIADAEFANPAGVEIRNGTIYIADDDNNIIRTIAADGVVRTFAGLANTFGGTDGAGANARFGDLADIAFDSSGNLYVIDDSHYTIRKITPSGAVTTLAGSPGQSGSVDGTGPAARFQQMLGIVVDRNGNVFVSTTNHTIRKITAAGVVTTFAGVSNVSGSADGQGSAARFSSPAGLACDGDGNVYVADSGNHTIRRITPDGVVTTFAGVPGTAGFTDGQGAGALFSAPIRMTIDPTGHLYVVDGYGCRIRKISPSGETTALTHGNAGPASCGYVDANGIYGRFAEPAGIGADENGDVYVTDWGVIHRITPAGVVTPVAGWPRTYAGVDGPLATARFGWVSGVAIDANDQVYVADRTSNAIRKITTDGYVSTIASGSPVGSEAGLRDPRGVAVDSDGFVYVADTRNHTIRKISPTGELSTLAGLAGSAGSADGFGTAARFNEPVGVAAGPGGVVYVADMTNHTIRKITPDGTVSTLAGMATQSGSTDGTGSAARFLRPEGVAVDSAGNVYVAEGNHTIRRITPTGVVSTLAGKALFSGSIDGSGNAARFNSPRGIAVDASGALYVASFPTIRKMTLMSGDVWMVTTVAGVRDQRGTADGTGTAARFATPNGLAFTSDGRLFIADMTNRVIRVGAPSLPDAATIDAATGPLFVPRQLDTAPQNASEWSWSVIRRPQGSTNELTSNSVRNPTFVPDAAGLFTFRLRATDGTLTSITTIDVAATTEPMELGAPSDFSAVANGTTQVSLSWTPVNGATHYEVFRSHAGSPFVLHNSCPISPCTDFNVTPNATYVYKIRAVADGVSPFSTTDIATTSTFTDHSLTGKRAKAVHLLELQTAINAVRATAGLGATNFVTDVVSGAKIRASAIQELRDAIDPARAALGLTAIAYTDPVLSPQATAVKATHLAQLRSAVE